MTPNLVTLISTREAIRRIAEHVVGHRVNISDVLANQNITLEPLNGAHARHGGPKGLSLIRKKLETNCRGCLMDTKGIEYNYRSGLEAFVVSRTNVSFVPPSKLEECRRVLGGNVPTIEMETDDGTKISLALSQGCRGGCGVISQASRPEMFHSPSGTPYFAYRSIVTPAEEGVDGARIVIQPDLNIIPVRLEVILAQFYSLSGFHATAKFWEHIRFKERPVTHLYLETLNLDSEMSRTVLRFHLNIGSRDVLLTQIDPDEFSLMIEFGEPIPKGQRPFLWVDITKKGEETTRYIVDGLRPLLFPNHLPGEF